MAPRLRNFPGNRCSRARFGLACDPIELKPNKSMVVSLDATNHPIFTGNALWNSVNTQESALPSDVAAQGSAAAAKAARTPQSP